MLWIAPSCAKSVREEFEGDLPLILHARISHRLMAECSSRARPRRAGFKVAPPVSELTNSFAAADLRANSEVAAIGRVAGTIRHAAPR